MRISGELKLARNQVSNSVNGKRKTLKLKNAKRSLKRNKKCSKILWNKKIKSLCNHARCNAKM